jgi:hypothetical protein
MLIFAPTWWVSRRTSGPIIELPIVDNQHVKGRPAVRGRSAALPGDARCVARLQLTEQDSRARRHDSYLQIGADATRCRCGVRQAVPGANRAAAAKDFVTANDVFNASRMHSEGRRCGPFRRAEGAESSANTAVSMRGAAASRVYDAKRTFATATCARRSRLHPNLNIAVGQYGNEGRGRQPDRRSQVVRATLAKPFLASSLA